MNVSNSTGALDRISNQTQRQEGKKLVCLKITTLEFENKDSLSLTLLLQILF